EFTVYGTVTGTDQPARAIVTVHDAGGGTLTGPESVAGGQPFELTLAVNGAGADVLALDATVTFDGDKVEWIGTGDILKDGLALVGEDAKPGKVRLILAN
ncbi:hypothetical protein K0U00_51015, partial [Paenibacillus sepulcri]|nr:hypothetical protein [Paenibacillus sepulcri]